jgi:hypothetical protein
MIDDHGLAFDVYRTLPGLILCFWNLWIRMMNPARVVGFFWGGRGPPPHPHIYPSLLLEGSFFSALLDKNNSCS